MVSFDNAAREVFVESMKGVIPFETVANMTFEKQLMLSSKEDSWG